MEMDSCMEDSKNNTDFKACMNFKWTDELTLRFILLRHERRSLFTKKRNTSRYGWQQILSDMGLSLYVTPYQAQKKWNNLWSKYKLAKRAQEVGVPEEDPNSSWPFFTVLDAIASGKAVSLASPVAGSQALLMATGGTVPTSSVAGFSVGASTTSNMALQVSERPCQSKDLNKSGNEEDSCDPQQQIVELLQANLQQLDEIKCAIETQGQTVAGLLSQLLHVLTGGVKEETSANSRIDQAISATIHEIGITQDNIE